MPLSTLIPAFILSELKTAFIIGFVIFIPFLIIDLVVSSTLMSMGMFMLPPVLVSLPFKLLLFVMVDGWALVVQLAHHELQPLTVHRCSRLRNPKYPQSEVLIPRSSKESPS